MGRVLELSPFFNSLPKTDIFTVDIGNTKIRKAYFKNGSLSEIYELKTLQEVEILIESSEIPVVVSSVRKSFKSTFSDAFTSNSFFDMPVSYSETLGHDRLITSYLLFHWLKDESVIIDCGTFLTVDFVSSTGFQGGYIIPGAKVLASSYLSGDQLFEPECSIQKFSSEKENVFPSNTRDAIQNGYEIVLKGTIDKVKSLAKDREIILTGGGADTISPLLPQAIKEPNLVHLAMYFQYVKASI